MALFEKYGGREFWTDAVDIFYERITHDPLLAQRFEGKDVMKVKAMNTQLLECTLGNNSIPLKVSIRQVHRTFGVPKNVFYRFLELFVGVLREKGVSDEDLDEVGDVLTSFEDDVVQT